MDDYKQVSQVVWSEIPTRVSRLMTILPEERDFVFEQESSRSDIYSLYTLEEGKSIPPIQGQVFIGSALEASDVRKALDVIVPHSQDIDYLPVCLRLSKGAYKMFPGWGIFASYPLGS